MLNKYIVLFCIVLVVHANKDNVHEMVSVDEQ